MKVQISGAGKACWKDKVSLILVTSGRWTIEEEQVDIVYCYTSISAFQYNLLIQLGGKNSYLLHSAARSPYSILSIPFGQFLLDFCLPP